MTEPKSKANRLAGESSPYLLQHAHNPVDWYPWGSEALERAMREDKPLLVSIGYSACHWCHVMARECFENPEIAALMNEHFVCIKVDREERPDIDEVYMAATLLLTGSGGWPMTVFCTPEQTPFFAGTYFPPEDRAHRPGFPRLLQRIAKLWEEDRDRLFRQGGELADLIRAQGDLAPPRSVGAETIERALAELGRTFDSKHGGFGGAPKFPPNAALRLLLTHHFRTGSKPALTMLETTLDGMKNGGLYDQLGGGFARYSVDEAWFVPHFEKMLYDNAQLARTYLEAYQVTRNSEYERVVRETLDFVRRDLQSTQGSYHCAIAADSEGQEGKYYVFTAKEVRSLLEPEETRAVCAHYGITEAGNWEGRNILHVARPVRDLAKDLKADADELALLIQRGRHKLLRARSQRVAPLIDDKVLAGWNGLMIGAMAEASRVLGADVYSSSATSAADFAYRHLRLADGRLRRSTRAGQTPNVPAVLEDYAYLADGLLDLYEANGNEHWLTWARELARVMLEDFYDEQAGAFFQTSHRDEPLIARLRAGFDGSLPNPSMIAARVLLRLRHHVDHDEYGQLALSVVRAYGERIERQPGSWLTALTLVDWLLEGPIQLVFAGGFEHTFELRRAAAQHYLPHKVIAHPPQPRQEPQEAARAWQQLQLGEEPALHVCRDYSCLRPVTTAREVGEVLATQGQVTSKKRTLRLQRIDGHATPEGTRRYFERQRIDPSAIHRLGKHDGWYVSRVGFGGHRVSDRAEEHQRALSLALREGCNVLDTAPSYMAGASERAIGNTLFELIRRQELARDEVVVVSKLGLFQVSPKETTDAAPPIALENSLAYSLQPAHLSQQLQESLRRLNLETLDVCLIHDPELLIERASEEVLVEQLSRAFTWLDEQVAARRVMRYGVSSNTLARANSPLTLELLLRAAQTAGAGRFEVLQVPLNLLERDALAPEFLRQVQAAGLSLMTHRPLNALRAQRLFRLARAPEDPTAPDLGQARASVAALEHEFRAQLGAVLRAVPDIELPVEELFTWSTRVDDEVLTSWETWSNWERSVLARELPHVMGALDTATRDNRLRQLWLPWRQRYVQAMELFVLAARNVSATNTNQRNRPLDERLRRAAPQELASAQLSQLSLLALSSQPAVSVTLIGMRTPGYARDALATLRWQEWADVPWENVSSFDADEARSSTG